MNNQVRFIIDSSVDVAPELRHRFTVLPLVLRFGDTEYQDGVDLKGAAFYEKLAESDVLPTTSQASPYTFGKFFREAVEAGQDVICLTLSSRLSGTFQSAMLAAEEFPDRVFVVDSRNATIGAAVQAEYGLRLLDEGKSAREVADILIRERSNVRLVAIVNTLEYLRRGGRISKTAAMAGELLNIKPVVGVNDGEVVILGKARGTRNAAIMMNREIEGAGGVDFSKPVMMGYSGASDQTLQKYLKDSAALWSGHEDQLRSSIVGSAIGTHVGPNGVAAAFYCKRGG